MRRRRIRRRPVIASAIGALLGAVILTALAGWSFIGHTQTQLMTWMNSCIPPCPHSTATYHEDWFTGRRWIAVSTVDQNGVPMASEDIEEPPFGGTLPDLAPIALVGAASGGIVGLGVSRTRRGGRSTV